MNELNIYIEVKALGARPDGRAPECPEIRLASASAAIAVAAQDTIVPAAEQKQKDNPAAAIAVATIITA